MIGRGNSSRIRDSSLGCRNTFPGVSSLNKTMLDPTAPLQPALMELPSPG